MRSGLVNGKITPPDSLTEALSRRQQLNYEIGRIKYQLDDPRRREKYVTEDAFDTWRIGAKRCLAAFVAEELQLTEWINANPETDLLRDVQKLLHVLREDVDLDPDEIAVIERLDMSLDTVEESERLKEEVREEPKVM